LLQVLAGGGVWRDAGRLPEAALAQQIRQDEIDILVELTGAFVGVHTVSKECCVGALQ
jgi:predicted O-linked N-acetylglucosamine transferase (SPINDLY family)